MTRCASVAPLGSEFDTFLFAPIGEDTNGMFLTVLSALARLGVDPWKEAADLARLSRAGAIQRLASLIEALPDRPSEYLNPRTTAARLIALLPQLASSENRSPDSVPRAGPLTRVHAVEMVLLCIALLALMLGSQIVMASLRPSTNVVGFDAPASGAVSPQTTPPRFSK